MGRLLRRLTTTMGGRQRRLSAAFSSFVVTPTVFNANGVAVANVDITAKDASNVAIADLSGSMTPVAALIDLAASSFVCLDTQVANDGTTPANFLVTLVDTDGFPVWGVPASEISVASSRGATDTITEQDTETDYLGQFVVTATSLTVGTPVFTLTVCGLVITQTATVEFTGAPALPTLDFHSDWSTATGTSDAAIRDTGKAVPWATEGGSSEEILANPGTLGFPAALVNIYGNRMITTQAAWGEVRITTLTVIIVGEARYYRMYRRVSSDTDVIPAHPTGDDETHGTQDGSASSQINWGWWIYHNTGGANKFTLQWRPGSNGGINAYPNDRWQLTTALDKDVTYRYEWKITRDATGTFKVEIRIYDEAGVLQFTEADFDNQTGSTDLATYMASNSFTLYNATHLGQLQCGLNGLANIGTWGPGVLPAAPPPYMYYTYQGAMATGIDCGWIGAYNAVNEA